jgi:hypothetical protein
MPKKVFKMTIKVRGCDKVFKEGFPPGVLVEQLVTYKLPRNYSRPLFARELIDQESTFLKDNIEVVTEEVQ